MSGTTTVFYGGVINPQSLTEYAALPRCLLAVGASGNIEWLVEDVPAHELESVLAQKGYSTVDIDLVELKKGEFLMPGFVDTHTVSSISSFALSGGDRELMNVVIACTAGSKHRNVSASSGFETRYS